MIGLLDREVPQYRSVIKFCRRGRTSHDEISGYLAMLVDQMGMRLAVPGIVTGWCEKGLGGWAHITTSCISLMEYLMAEEWIVVTVEMYSCREYDLAGAADLTATVFGVAPGDMLVYRTVLELVA